MTRQAVLLAAGWRPTSTSARSTLLRERAVAGPRQRRAAGRASATAATSRTARCCASVRERLRATRTWAEAILEDRRTAPAARSRPAPGPTSTSRPRRWPSRCGSAIARCARPATPSSPTAAWPTSCAALACFGLTLARLDIRQDSARHTAALTRSPRARPRPLRGMERRGAQQFLMRELGGRRPLVPPHLEASPEVQDVLRHLPDAGAAAAGSLGAYVITMARCRPTCWPWSCCRASPAWPGRCAWCRCSRPRTTCARPAR